MTLTELQDKLREQITLITDENTPYEEKKKLADVATVVSSLAKQMINNADVILRTEKLIAEGKDVKPVRPLDAVEVVRCKSCIHHTNCEIEFTGQFGDNSY